MAEENFIFYLKSIAMLEMVISHVDIFKTRKLKKTFDKTRCLKYIFGVKSAKKISK